MDHGLKGKFLCQSRFRNRVAHRDARHGDYMFGQLERLDELIDIVGDGAEPAEAESERFGGHAGVLGGDKRVYNGPMVGLEVAVGIGISVAVFTKAVEASKIGAESENNGRFGRHGLVEVERGEFLFHRLIARDNDAEQLHIAHGGAAAGSFQNQVKGFVIHLAVGVLAHAHMVKQGIQSIVHDK